jgi:hypothetical protein
MYELRYGQDGTPNIYINGSNIPVDERNSDFRAFLEWNAQQVEPLDWQTPIEIEVPLPVPSTEERIAAMEDTILAMLLGG